MTISPARMPAQPSRARGASLSRAVSTMAERGRRVWRSNRSRHWAAALRRLSPAVLSPIQTRGDELNGGGVDPMNDALEATGQAFEASRASKAQSVTAALAA